MKWYPYLYVGEGASKKKNKIIRKLKIGAGMIDVWVITEAANGEDQFDILSSAWLKQRAVRKKLPMILVARRFGFSIWLMVWLAASMPSW